MTTDQAAAQFGTAHRPGPLGLPRLPPEEGIDPYSSCWAFYACPRLGLGLYQIASGPLSNPGPRLRLLVPDLGIAADAHLCGVGEEGYQTLAGLGEPYDDPVFPIDMNGKPRRLRPRPSPRVSEEDHRSWQALVAALAQPRGRSVPRPAEDRPPAPHPSLAAIVAKLALGMTRKEVREALGDPDQTGGETRKHPIPSVYRYEAEPPWHIQICFGPGQGDGLFFVHAQVDDQPHAHAPLLQERRGVPRECRRPRRHTV